MPGWSYSDEDPVIKGPGVPYSPEKIAALQVLSGTNTPVTTTTTTAITGGTETADTNKGTGIAAGISTLLGDKTGLYIAAGVAVLGLLILLIKK